MEMVGMLILRVADVKNPPLPFERRGLELLPRLF